MRAVRWQPPVYSPLPSGAAWHSLLLGASVAGDPRRRVTRTLLQAFGAEAAVLCGSGPEALQLALRVAHRLRGAGAIVAVPAFTCFGVATAVVGADARVALYDVDPATLAPDLDSLRLALREGAQVVVASPLFGVPLDWCALEECTASSGALIIEDAAQGQGVDGRPRGCVATSGCASPRRRSLLRARRPVSWNEVAGGCPGVGAVDAWEAPPLLDSRRAALAGIGRDSLQRSSTAAGDDPGGGALARKNPRACTT